jgi:hypothetical protein
VSFEEEEAERERAEAAVARAAQAKQLESDAALARAIAADDVTPSRWIHTRTRAVTYTLAYVTLCPLRVSRCLPRQLAIIAA